MGKNHHYVPQFYLRNFSFHAEKKNVRAALVVTGESFAASIKNQSSKAYFYGYLDDTEVALSKVECEIAISVANVISGSGYSDSGLLEFLIILAHIRTERAAEVANVMVEKTLSDIANSVLPDNVRDIIGGLKAEILCPGFVAMWGLEGYVDAIKDLSFCVVKNITSREFVTSDNPSILYNCFLERMKFKKSTRGAALYGTFFFLPISPRFGVILYDKLTYSIELKMKNGVYILNDKGDVDRLNCLQVIFCKSVVYFTSEFMLRHIRLYLRKFALFRSQYKSSLTVFREVSKNADGSSHLIRDDDLIENYERCSKMYLVEQGSVAAGISFFFLRIRKAMLSCALPEVPIRPVQFELYKERIRQREEKRSENET